MGKISFKQFIKERLEDKALVCVICIYLAFMLFSAIYFVVDFNLRNLLISLGYSLFVIAILLAEYLLRLRTGWLFAFLLLFIPLTAILGSCFDFYGTIPFLDLIQHCISGVVFGALGVALATVFFGSEENSKGFIGRLMFGLFFSLAIATLWEIFEYGLTFLGFDMMEDTIINGFESYLLAGTHNATVQLNDITQTVIYYGNGQAYVLNGHLDIGLIDTLGDMIICSIGAVAFSLVSIISYYKCPKINQTLIPRIKK